MDGHTMIAVWSLTVFANTNAASPLSLFLLVYPHLHCICDNPFFFLFPSLLGCVEHKANRCELEFLHLSTCHGYDCYWHSQFVYDLNLFSCFFDTTKQSRLIRQRYRLMMITGQWISHRHDTGHDTTRHDATRSQEHPRRPLQVRHHTKQRSATQLKFLHASYTNVHISNTTQKIIEAQELPHTTTYQ